MTISADPDYQQWLRERRKTQEIAKEPNGNSRYLSHKGERHTLKQWASITGLTYSTIRQRLHHGWPVEKVLETKAMKNQYKTRE